jgi:enamine deaminase RidA (YjgF/YER057c/UK114 family)
MRIYVTSADAYAAASKEIGKAYRERFGRWFPAMTLVQVARLFDPAAAIEVEAEAVVPD